MHGFLPLHVFLNINSKPIHGIRESKFFAYKSSYEYTSYWDFNPVCYTIEIILIPIA